MRIFSLRPLALELVGERRLPQLLEQRAVLLRDERVLDELLRDGGGALGGALAAHVLPRSRARCPCSRRPCACRSAGPRSRSRPASRSRRSRCDLTRMRFSARSARRAASCPVSSSRTELRAARNSFWASSSGRSCATAIIIPKTVETSASASRPASVSPRRNLWSCGRSPPRSSSRGRRVRCASGVRHRGGSSRLRLVVCAGRPPSDGAARGAPSPVALRGRSTARAGRAGRRAKIVTARTSARV